MSTNHIHFFVFYRSCDESLLCVWCENDSSCVPKDSPCESTTGIVAVMVFGCPLWVSTSYQDSCAGLHTSGVCSFFRNFHVFNVHVNKLPLHYNGNVFT